MSLRMICAFLVHYWLGFWLDALHLMRVLLSATTMKGERFGVFRRS